ncbi:hypothetical protein EMPG_13374 [Blastomyces silverae]|uniref:Uncharacterized protein n=1 Tax=Blastomyces silverae TaxID=2060906 RepID=A0A0H1BQD7_9EURO|nr:hypothetical protein EMPG_13374 [Blastomyces silverae]
MLCKIPQHHARISYEPIPSSPSHPNPAVLQEYSCSIYLRILRSLVATTLSLSLSHTHTERERQTPWLQC